MWQNISNRNLEQQIKTIINRIHNTISNSYTESNNISLFGGETGILLFTIYYNKLHKSKNSILSKRILSNIFNKINLGFDNLSYAEGISGIAHGLNILQNENISNIPDVSEINSLNDLVYSSLMNDINSSFHDLLYGSVGKANYLLESNYFNKTTLIELSNSFYKGVDIKNTVLNWKKHSKTSNNEEIYDLGIAHGLPGLLILLSKIYRLNPTNEELRKRLILGVEFIFKRMRNDSSFFSLFPPVLKIGDPNKEESRLAWCYGDLSVGIALFHIAINLSNRNILNIAFKILMHTTTRKDLEITNVVDPGLCHGSTGLANMYSRLFNYTKRQEFKDAAKHWLKISLESFLLKDDYYLEYEKTFKSHSLGLLIGYAGIGLALISAISEIEPKWDNVFLLS